VRRVSQVRVVGFDPELNLLAVRFLEGREPSVGMLIRSEDGATAGRIAAFALGTRDREIRGYGLAQDSLRGVFTEGSVLGVYEEN
jgi:hypothetical protein